MAQAKDGTVIFVVVLLAILVGAIVWIGIGQRAIRLDEDGIDLEPKVPIAAGKSATISLAAFDHAADSLTQVVMYDSAYSWKDGQLITNTGDLSASARLDIDEFSTGDSGTAIAFNNSAASTQDVSGGNVYYGFPKEFDVNSQSVPVDLEVYESISAQTGLLVDWYIDGVADSDVTGTASQCGTLVVTLTGIGANGENDVDKMTVKVNAANDAFQLAGIGFKSGSQDAAATNHIDNIEIEGYTRVAMPYRLRQEDYDHYFEIPEVLLTEWEEWSSPRIIFSGDGTGAGADGHNVTYSLIDSNYFINKNNQLAKGIETDAATPLDTGFGDMYYCMNVTA